jgi:hypothetical protein
MGEHDQNRQPESRYPGLNQSPSGSSWPDPVRQSPRTRLWLIAVTAVALVGGIVAIILLTQH